jgi:hypothetical protein
MTAINDEDSKELKGGWQKQSTDGGGSEAARNVAK